MRLERLAVVVGLVCVAGWADDPRDNALRSYFEGKQVVVKMDMPADVKGVDVHPEAERIVDFRQLGDRIKRYGVSVRKGDSVMVTKVHIKGKTIEFQLNGGGFGTAADRARMPSAPSTYVSKSSRERDLEKERSSTTDSSRRASIDRELDYLRRERQREEDRRRREAAIVNAEKRAIERDARPNSGSRFNLHFNREVTDGDAHPRAVMAALAEYVDFPAAAFPESPGGKAPGDPKFRVR